MDQDFTPQSRHRLGVIIVNYRTPALVQQCLDLLLPDLGDVDASIVVVDNASGDKSVDILNRWVRKNAVESVVRIVSSPTNLGFAGGNNLGLDCVDADFYLLLNSDAIVRTGAIAVMISAALADPAVGVLGPQLEDSDGTPQVSCFHDHTAIGEFLSAARTGALTGLLKPYQVPIEVDDRCAHPDWISFACVLIRKEVFESVGFLDDGFFMYFEDAEFCRRAREANWNIAYVPAARVVHLQGGSSNFDQKKRARKRLPRYYYESRSRYFSKIYGDLGLTMANLMWSCGRLISWIREKLERRESGFPESQWRDIWIAQGSSARSADIR